MELNYQENVPYVGTNGNWFVNGVDTGTKAQGDTPYIARDGFWYVGETNTKVRAAGNDGMAPHIGMDGYWYLGEKNLEVKAEGPQGPKGDDGEPGSQGLQGEIGPRGEKGDKGDTGAQGSKGDVGQIDMNFFFSKMYPVGSIYMSVKNENPSTIFGGTWNQWGGGRVPVGVNVSDNNFSTVEKNGGVSSTNLQHTHTVSGHVHATSSLALTVAQMPAHTHAICNYNEAPGHEPWYPDNKQPWGIRVDACEYPLKTHWAIVAMNNEGGGRAHNHGNTGSASPTTNSQLGKAISNLQPYITCYMWKRTA